MPTEQDIEAKLCAYIEGELDASGRAEVEQFLATNPRHRALLEELKHDRIALRGLVRVPAPPEIAEAFARQLERAALLGDDGVEEDRQRIRTARWRQIAAAAAILVLVGGLAAGVALILPSSGPKLLTSALRPAPQAVDKAPSEPETADAAKPQNPQQAINDDQSASNAVQKQQSQVAQNMAGAAVNTDRLAAEAAHAQPGVVGNAIVSPPALAENNSNEQATGLTGARDLAMAAGALHEALGSAGEQSAPGGAIYLVLRATDSDAQVQRIHATLNAAAVQWMPLAAPSEAAPTTQPAMQLQQDRALAGSAPTTQPQNHVDQAMNSQLNDNAGSNEQKGDQQNASAAPPPIIVVARALDRDRAEALAAELSGPANSGVVGHDVFRAFAGADGARTRETAGMAGGPALLLVGQRVTLVAQDPVVKDADAFHETQQIDGDGNVTIPVVGKVRAAGLLPADLERTINRAYSDAAPPTRATWHVSAEPSAATTHPADAINLPTTGPAAAAPAAVDLVIVVHSIPPPAVAGPTSQPSDATPNTPAAPPEAAPSTTEPATSPS